MASKKRLNKIANEGGYNFEHKNPHLLRKKSKKDLQMTDDWTKTESLLPPENVVVETMDSSGHVQQLVRQGKLFFFPDKSMNVYYTPTFWKSLK